MSTSRAPRDPEGRVEAPGSGARPAPRADDLGLRTVVEASFEPLAACLAGRVVEVNGELCALLGVTREQLLGAPLSDLFSPDSLQDPLAHVALADRTPCEGRMRHRDGRLVPVEARATRATVGQHSVELVSVRDLSWRTAAEQRVDEAARRYRDLAEMLPVIIGETDREGHLTFVNRNGSALLGYSDGGHLGRSILELIAPDERARAAANFGRRKAGIDLAPSTYRLLHKDGHEVPMELRAANVYEGGAMVGVRFVLVDVSARLRAERERLLFEQRLLDARRLESLGVLAGGVAHDFNNLLAVVLGNAELALLELERGASARVFVEDIRQASRRAADLTRQLLAYAGKAPFHRADVDLNAIVRESTAVFTADIARQAELKVDLDAALPAVHGDAAQLRQVVLNLVTNALEALEGRPGTVSLRTATATFPADAQPAGLLEPASLAPGRYALLGITDSGCGLAPDTLQRAFEPFFSTKFTGRGLGLAAVLGIVRAHRGGIGVVTGPGQGTRVEVYLPLHAVVTSGPDPHVPPTPTPQARPKALVGQVLVVDDEPTVAAVTGRVLRRLGLTVITTDGGEAAVALLGGAPAAFDAVLLDATLGGIGGPETLARLRAIRADLPIVLCSGYAEARAREGFADDAIAGFLQKPFDLRVAAAMMGRVLAKSAP